MRILEARQMLALAGKNNAPPDVIDALCRWIGDMEKTDRDQKERASRR